MIIVLGSNGSMGRRYQAILRSLGLAYRGFDVGDPSPWEAMRQSDGIIIATPTPTHASFVAPRLGLHGIPILCEKPLATTLSVVDQMLTIDTPLQMMAQYRFLDPPGTGWTTYDYYRSGSDGLAWDCLTLLGLARGPVRLQNTSPVWTCCLNGRPLTFKQVEESYVEAVLDWRRAPEGDRSWIRYAHERAAEWVKASAGPLAERAAAPVLDATVPKSRDASR